jgi:hypothetical protein
MNRFGSFAINFQGVEAIREGIMEVGEVIFDLLVEPFQLVVGRGDVRWSAVMRVLRLAMQIVFDVSGDERRSMGVADLALFKRDQGEDLSDDALLLD